MSTSKTSLTQHAFEIGPIWAQFCGAIIISESKAITAGHCTKELQLLKMRVRAGASIVSEGSIHNVEKLIVHENFSLKDMDFDISIAVVSEPFIFGPTIQPAPIARAVPAPGDVALVTGWGITTEGDIQSAPVLQKVEIPILANEECGTAYADKHPVTDRMICGGADGRGACFKDSGGPLIVNGTLAGIVSWGEGCGRPGFPEVYTNVAYFADWIDGHLRT